MVKQAIAWVAIVAGIAALFSLFPALTEALKEQPLWVAVLAGLFAFLGNIITARIARSEELADSKKLEAYRADLLTKQSLREPYLGLWQAASETKRAAHEALLGQLASRFPELGLPRDPPYGRHAWGSFVLHGPPGNAEDGEWISELRRHGLGMRPGPVLAALPDRPEVLSYWPASTHCPNAAWAARTTAFLPRSVALGIAPAEGGPTP